MTTKNTTKNGKKDGVTVPDDPSAYKRGAEAAARGKKDLEGRIDDILKDALDGVSDEEMKGIAEETRRMMERIRDDVPAHLRKREFRNRLIAAGEIYERFSAIRLNLEITIDDWEDEGRDRCSDFIPKKDIDTLKRFRKELTRMIDEMDGRMSVWLVEDERR